MSTAVPVSAGIGAANDTTRQLTRIWEDLLGVRPIEADQNYFDLGGDSLLAVQMFAQVDKVFGVKLPVATLFEAPTVGELAKVLVEETASRSRWSSIVAIQPKGTRPPFFCVHGAGGNVLIYRELSKRLGEDQPFYGLQSQGLDGESEPLEKIEEMAAIYAAEIRRVQPKGPYHLGGYCLGGTIAYEVAQQLRAQGEEVALLALFDTLNWYKLPPLNSWKKFRIQVDRVAFHVLNYFRLDAEGRKSFVDDKFQVVRNRIPVWRGALANKVGGLISGNASKEIALSRVWELNDIASMEYVPKPYPGRVTDFRPIAQYTIHRGEGLKWEGLAQEGQKVVPLPMYPAGMLVEPYVKVLADALRAEMDVAIANRAGR